MVYNSYEEARVAHELFMSELDELEVKYGVNTFCDDSCVDIYHQVQYRDQDGKVKFYS